MLDRTRGKKINKNLHFGKQIYILENIYISENKFTFRKTIYISENKFTFQKTNLHFGKQIYISENKFTFQKTNLHLRKQIYILENKFTFWKTNVHFKSGYHLFFPFLIANQKSNNEKLTGYFVFHYNTKNEKMPVFFQISLLGSDQKYEMEKRVGHQDRLWFLYLIGRVYVTRKFSQAASGHRYIQVDAAFGLVRHVNTAAILGRDFWQQSDCQSGSDSCASGKMPDFCAAYGCSRERNAETNKLGITFRK